MPDQFAYIGFLAYICCLIWLTVASVPRRGDARGQRGPRPWRRIRPAALGTGVSFASAVVLLLLSSEQPFQWHSLLGVWVGIAIFATLGALGSAWVMLGYNRATLGLSAPGEPRAPEASAASRAPHS